MCNLRPRYSLLTLLVLTALVAGGVKLWYGPHHVVERPWPDWEKEYTCSYDWLGNRVVNCPVIYRQFVRNELARIYIRYFRHGIDSEWLYYNDISYEHSLVLPTMYLDFKVKCPLSEHELATFHQTRDAELGQPAASGTRHWEGGSTTDVWRIFGLE